MNKHPITGKITEALGSGARNLCCAASALSQTNSPPPIIAPAAHALYVLGLFMAFLIGLAIVP